MSTWPAGLAVTSRSERSASADNTQQNDDDGHDQKNVDQSTGDHRGGHSEKPQDNEDNSKGIEHFLLSD